jgi:hypothetical protein
MANEAIEFVWTFKRNKLLLTSRLVNFVEVDTEVIWRWGYVEAIKNSLHNFFMYFSDHTSSYNSGK